MTALQKRFAMVFGGMFLLLLVIYIVVQPAAPKMNPTRIDLNRLVTQVASVYEKPEGQLVDIPITKENDWDAILITVPYAKPPLLAKMAHIDPANAAEFNFVNVTDENVHIVLIKNGHVNGHVDLGPNVGIATSNQMIYATRDQAHFMEVVKVKDISRPIVIRKFK